MRSPQIRAEVLRLVDEGINDCEISRRTGVPRTTVRDMRHRGALPVCPRCWRCTKSLVFRPETYAELLGLYLGDGCISRLRRTYSLRISLDVKYPGLIARIRTLLAECFPSAGVSKVIAGRGTTAVVQVYSSHLPCLFPQHGPGKKHDRLIALEGWQRAHIEAAPFAFLRGLIHSDGCFFVNRTGRYEYLSVDFANLSQDILGLFCATCDLVGVEYRLYAKRVRIYRRASVQILENEVGLKF